MQILERFRSSEKKANQPFIAKIGKERFAIGGTISEWKKTPYSGKFTYTRPGSREDLPEDKNRLFHLPEGSSAEVILTDPITSEQAKYAVVGRSAVTIEDPDEITLHTESDSLPEVFKSDFAVPGRAQMLDKNGKSVGQWVNLPAKWQINAARGGYYYGGALGSVGFGKLYLGDHLNPLIPSGMGAFVEKNKKGGGLLIAGAVILGAGLYALDKFNAPGPQTPAPAPISGTPTPTETPKPTAKATAIATAAPTATPTETKPTATSVPAPTATTKETNTPVPSLEIGNLIEKIVTPEQAAQHGLDSWSKDARNWIVNSDGTATLRPPLDGSLSRVNMTNAIGAGYIDQNLSDTSVSNGAINLIVHPSVGKMDFRSVTLLVLKSSVTKRQVTDATNTFIDEAIAKSVNPDSTFVVYGFSKHMDPIKPSVKLTAADGATFGLDAHSRDPRNWTTLNDDGISLDNDALNPGVNDGKANKIKVDARDGIAGVGWWKVKERPENTAFGAISFVFRQQTKVVYMQGGSLYDYSDATTATRGENNLYFDTVANEAKLAAQGGQPGVLVVVICKHVPGDL